MANVTVIPATRNLHTGIRNDAVAKRKTAGYARVSTDSEEQLTSYEAIITPVTSSPGRNGNSQASIRMKASVRLTRGTATALTKWCRMRWTGRLTLS